MYDVILTCNYSPWSRYSGGGQKSTHMIASALAGMGKRVCVVYSRGPFERVREPADLPYDVAWAFFFALRPGISSPLRFLNGISFFLKARALCGPGTALHGNGDEASLLGFVRRRRCFVHSHRYPGFEPYMRRADWSRPWTWIRIALREPRFVAMALALRRADAVACTSADSAALLRKCFQVSGGKIRIIPNGIDPAFLAAPLAGPGGRGVVYFGRMTRAKGVDVLLRAYAGLSPERRGAHPLTLIGDGPYLPELRRLAKDLGIAENLRWKGWTDSEGLARAITAHRLVALPSREESFGNTMLETLATGRTLVTTRAGSIPEVVGDQALLVPPDDPAALREALEEALAAPFDPARAAARREYVRERYSWEKTAEACWKLYDS